MELTARLDALDWEAIGRGLDDDGYATTPAILSPAECDELIALYPDRSAFRSKVDMARFRFGVGEYKYMAAPLPAIVQQLRISMYPRLAQIGNRWMEQLKSAERFPPSLSGFLKRCRANGQTKPTPLILRYEAGGYNCMHQDLYGEVAFPIQATFLLSRREQDFSGGEFLLLEQRPRAQSVGHSITLEQGEAILFANSFRPIAGARGFYRGNMRHGVSRLHRGLRFTLGIIFHDAR